VSHSHQQNQNEPRISTLFGISIDRSDEDENASDSIRVNRELDSNEIDVSDLHFEKHDEPRTSMSNGISRCDDVEKLRINL
jgi:hypothetical protein